MNISKLLQQAALAVFALGSVMSLAGCNAMNDNPIDADKMATIRKKQEQERKAFNPQATPPPATTGMPAKR